MLGLVLLELAAVNATSVTPALIGLVGVAGGGLITAGMQLRVEHSRERRDERATRALTRAAARILWDDLSRADAVIRAAKERGRWNARFSVPSKLDDADRKLLAIAMASTPWQQVAVAEGLVAAWGLRETGELTEAAELVDTTISLLRVALDALVPLADLALSNQIERSQ